MSRAFVREPEGGEAFEDLPDRTISPHHLVTPAGLARMDAEIEALEQRLTEAQVANNFVAAYVANHVLGMPKSY